MTLDGRVVLELTYFPGLRWVSNAPFGATSKHLAKDLPTPRLDLDIANVLTPIGFCLQNNIPQPLTKEGLSS